MTRRHIRPTWNHCCKVLVTINHSIISDYFKLSDMEKFIVIGKSEAKNVTVQLSLPIAKYYEPHVVNKCEEQVYPLDIINQG